MSSITSSRRPLAARVARFLRTPKGYVLLLLGLLMGLGALAEGPGQVLPGVAGAMAAAALVDVALARLIRRAWILPDGALVTGLIVGMLLDPAAAWYVPLGTAALAIASKYLLHSRWSNVFNPAALALVVSYFAFGAGQSWWGALPDLPAPAVLVVGAVGVFVANRINKLPMVLVFLAGYFALFAGAAFLGDPASVAEIFRAPDLNAVVFFAFFMLDDPPTSPTRYADQVYYGLIVALVGFSIFELLGAVYFLPAGLLLGNAWETLRRLDVQGASRPRPARTSSASS